jgi:hypothetical protein
MNCHNYTILVRSHASDIVTFMRFLQMNAEKVLWRESSANPRCQRRKGRRRNLLRPYAFGQLKR